ncbi:MAG TPA: hypothetical protein VFM59_03180 [Salinimicrobium sp.]|nr:hypothetical protein [Salinimicrobium sp.]
MKRIKFSIAWMAMFALIFTSCSKDENASLAEDQELIQLTFGSLLNDMKVDQTKQATPGECREGTPFYVMVGITDSDGNYVGGGTSDVHMIEVGLKNNNGSWETTYSEDLALPAGEYQLQHFVVYDTNEEVLWVAPREEGTFGDYVPDALPLDINLAPGTKPYINVDVLCYFPREEVAYGYLFFDINLTRVENSYCIFVNYCDDETGREYPAYFEVEVWSDEAHTEVVNINADTNVISMVNGLPSASVLCFALPDLGNNTYFARVTVLNHDDLDYTADNTDFYDFEITQNSIEALEDAIPSYDHIRINCAAGDNEPDPGEGGDPVCDIDVACELDVPNPLDDYCFETSLAGSDAGWVKVNGVSDFNLVAQITGPGGTEEVALAEVQLSLINNEIAAVLDTPFEELDKITGYAIEVRPSNEDGSMSTTCWESTCASVADTFGPIVNTFDGYEFEYPFYVRVSTVSCFTPDVLPE